MSDPLPIPIAEATKLWLSLHESIRCEWEHEQKSADGENFPSTHLSPAANRLYDVLTERLLRDAQASIAIPPLRALRASVVNP